MLAKLLKYDFKNMGTTIIPMYLCLALFAALDRVIHFLQKSDVFSQVKAVKYIANYTQVFLVIGLISLFLMVLVVGIHYYKDNIMRDEGYLMHTLPVSAYQLVASKIITFLFYVALSAVAAYLILAFDFENLCWYRKVYTDILSFMSKSKAIFLCVNVGVYILVYLAFCIQTGYLAINIGYSYNSRLRPVAIVAVIMLFLMISKSGELLIVYFCGRAGYMNMDIENITMEAIQALFLSVNSLYAVLSVVCYTLAGRWLQKHLDLD